jgi:hypothetical protein
MSLLIKAAMRGKYLRLPFKYNYLSDRSKSAVQLVLQQVEFLANVTSSKGEADG